jgi:hypothetical protein
MPDDLATKRRKARERFAEIWHAALALLFLARLKIIADERAFAFSLQTELVKALAENFVSDRTPLQREQTRDAYQEAFDQAMRRFAATAAAARSLEEVEPWLSSMAAANASHTLTQFSLGAGRPLLPSEMLSIAPRLRFDWSKLEGFAEMIAERAVTDTRAGETYIAARAILYGGTGRAAWYAGDELGSGYGVVIDYASRDDAGTCSPCLIAEEEGPYLPGEGPFPGAVCKGRGRCRCERTPRQSLTEYLRLLARSDRRSRFLEFH